MNAPDVDCEQHHASLAVRDIPAAVDFYTNKLGFTCAFTWGEPPNFAGVNLGDNVQMFLREGTPDPNGSVVFFVIGDADAFYEFHRANGSRASKSRPTSRGAFTTTPSATSKDTTSSSASACNNRSRLSRSNASTSPSASKNAWPQACSEICDAA